MLKNLIKVSVFNSSRYDAAIKAMKASPYYPTAEKLSQYRARELDAKKKRSIDGIDKHNWQPQNPRRQGEQDLDPDEYRKLIQKSISSERFERYMNMFHEPNYQ